MDLLALLDEATDAESKSKVLGSLIRADKTAVAAIGRDESCMQALAGWLEELASDRASFHVLELLCKVIGSPYTVRRMVDECHIELQALSFWSCLISFVQVMSADREFKTCGMSRIFGVATRKIGNNSFSPDRSDNAMLDRYWGFCQWQGSFSSLPR